MEEKNLKNVDDQGSTVDLHGHEQNKILVKLNRQKGASSHINLFKDQRPEH